MAAHKKHGPPPPPPLPWYETEFPAGFAPKPTVLPKGGIARMIACWEAQRDANTGGFAPGVLKNVWKAFTASTVTQCSPFTATTIGMVFDPDAAPTDATFAPTYFSDASTKTPLPFRFYEMHNGWDETLKADAVDWYTRNGWGDAASAPGSMLLWNLGYEIDQCDMRRGDLVEITWGWNGNGGHATFCWDVHLDAEGAVDAFLFVSGNGTDPWIVDPKTGKGHREYSGVGVSVGVAPGYDDKFVTKDASGKYTKAKTPLFQDDDDYVTYGWWQCLPKISAKSVTTPGTFKTPPISVNTDVGSLRVIRLWGVAPPDASTPRGAKAWTTGKNFLKFAEAVLYTREAPPAPYCMGAAGPPNVVIPKAQPQSIPAAQAKQPDAVEKVPTKPVVQDKTAVVVQQVTVEIALKGLFNAGWITTDPGEITSVNDAQTVAAVKDFQSRWALDVDGIVGPITRPALLGAWGDLVAGRSRTLKPAHAPTPNGSPPAQLCYVGAVHAAKPDIHHFYPLTNRVPPKGELRIAIEGHGLDILGLTVATVKFTDTRTGAEIRVPVPIPTPISSHAYASVTLPPTMALGSVWSVALECKNTVVGAISKSTEIALSVLAVHPSDGVPAATTGWPWDESKWPKIMQDIVAELRTTPTPSLPFSAQWCFSNYGVRERSQSVGPRDKKTGQPVYEHAADVVPLTDNKGNALGHLTQYSLWQGDIEGTIRLDGKVFNITQTGRPNGGGPPYLFDEFDPTQSFWEDVTDRCPWGAGSRIPLIPYRVLAINAKSDSDKYYKKVYVQALDGKKLAPTGEIHNGICVVGDCGAMDPGKQFDFFMGREDAPFEIDDDLGNEKTINGTYPLSLISILEDCAAAKR